MDIPTVPHMAPPEEEARFYEQYGRTLASWALLEMSLRNWFTYIVTPGETSTIAEHVFFSARSFQGRQDMLLAAMDTGRSYHCEAFLRLAVKRAGQYSSFRNRLAHGIVAFEVDTKAVGKMAILDHVDTTIRDGAVHFGEHIHLDQLVHAHRAIDTLGSILGSALNAARRDDQTSLEKYRELVLRLPTEIGSKGRSRNQAGRERQRQSALRSARKRPKTP